MTGSAFITAASTACALGSHLTDCVVALHAQRSGLVPLGGRLVQVPGLDEFAAVPAGLLPARALLKGRRYGAAGNAALHVAREAVAEAGWSAEQTGSAWVFAASSRGNVGEEAETNAWRRPIRRFSASNSMHGEIAAAISIELGIRGPWQMISNGCSSGLDALGLAWLAVSAGVAPRALVVAVDLPFVPRLLRDFRDTGLLSRNGVNDPFAPETSGFLPGEAVAAVTLEAEGSTASGRAPWCRVQHYAANSDAYDSLMIPADGGGIGPCVQAVWSAGATDRVVALCPHATGTQNHAQVEPPALERVMRHLGQVVPLLPLKPYTGHALGASGLLDVALLSACMAQRQLPGVLPGLTPPAGSVPLLTRPLPLKAGDRVLKLASGMGGHNAAVALEVI